LPEQLIATGENFILACRLLAVYIPATQVNQSGAPLAGGIMRIAVFVIGVIGVLASGFLGVKWFSDSRSSKFETAKDLTRLIASTGEMPPELKAEWAKVQAAVNGSYVLMAGAAVGLFGAILALQWRKLEAAVLLLACGCGPGLFVPAALVFSSPLLLAGGLAFFIGAPTTSKENKRRKKPARSRRSDSDED
jgi:hypothetical protein